MRRRVLVLMCLVFVSVFLSACFDAVEIENYAYVTMMGIDSGISDRLRFTFQIPKFTTGGGGGGSSNQGGQGGDEKQTEKENIAVDTQSLISGVAIINSSIPLILNFMHLNAIVVSEELATSGNIGEYLAPLIRYRQIRRNTNIIVCKGKAEEFLKATKPYLGMMVTKTLSELFNKSKQTGLFPKITLDDMYRGIKSEYRQILGPYGAVNKGENFQSEGLAATSQYHIPGDYYAGDVSRKGGQDIELLGSTVMNGDKMVGKLTGFETQMLLLVQGGLKKTVFTIPDPKNTDLFIPFEIKELETPKITVDVSGEKPKVHVILGLEGDISTVPSRINYEKPEMKQILEGSLEKFLKNGIERTFAKCKALKSDVFEFGIIAVKQFWTIPEWENYHWLDKFSDSELTVEVDFTIRRTGKLLKSMPIVSTEGKE